MKRSAAPSSPACGRRWREASDEGSRRSGDTGSRSGTTPHPTPLRGATFSRKREKEGPRLAVILVALLAFAQPATAGGVWHRGDLADPNSLDPHKASTAIEANILYELYEGLLTRDAHGVLIPGVAERWDVSDDKRSYTFHLRKDARWSNGTPLTADDFVYSFHRLMDPRGGAQYASIFYDLANARAVHTGRMPIDALGVRATDPLTLVITLEHPATYLLPQLAHFTALPVYRAGVERWGDGFARAGRLVGNGAFVLERYTPNDQLVLRKNPNYYDAAHVALDREIILPLDDRSAALRRFMGGEIDSYNDVPVDQVAWVRAHLGADFKVSPNLGSYFLALDVRHPPFDDKRVRQALSMVVDREFLAKTIWGGIMLPGYSFVAPGIASYGRPSIVTWAGESQFQREDEAQALMRAAGWGPDHPLHITLRFNQSENNNATAIALADMWKALGVTTQFVVTDTPAYYAFVESGQPYDAVRRGWFADFPDAQNFLFLAESDNPLNTPHFQDAAYDAMMRRAEAEAEPAARAKILHEAEAMLLAAGPYLPLLTYQSPNLVSPRLEGWYANTQDSHKGRWISIRDKPQG